MKLYVVSTPIGNVKDITFRAVEVLNNADLILCEDTRVTSLLFNKINVKGKLLSCHKFNETAISEKLASLFESYNNIAYVSDAGTPVISDPGAIIVDKARSLGAEIEAIPGASAVVTALSLCGLKYDHGFSFLGFLQREKGKQKTLFSKLFFETSRIVVFYESPNRIISTLENLEPEFVEKIFVFNDLTKFHEKHYVGTLSHVIDCLIKNENANKGEYVVVVKFKDNNSLSIASTSGISLEAKIVDEMFKTNTNIKNLLDNRNVNDKQIEIEMHEKQPIISVKEAISNLVEKGENKNQLYKASINLKNIFN